MGRPRTRFAAAWFWQRCCACRCPRHRAGHGGMRIVVAFPPGGPVDFVARMLADGWARSSSSTVIVDNKAGRQRRDRRAGRSPRPRPTARRCGSPASARRRSIRRSTTSCPTTCSAISRRCRWSSTTSRCWSCNPANPRATPPNSSRSRSRRADAMAIASSGIGSMPHLAMELLADSTRRQSAARALQGRRAGDHRRDGRPGRRILRRHPRPDRLIKGGKLKALGDRGAEAASAAARRADARRAGHPRRGIEQLVRAVRAGEDAAGSGSTR